MDVHTMKYNLHPKRNIQNARVCLPTVLNAVTKVLYFLTVFTYVSRRSGTVSK